MITVTDKALKVIAKSTIAATDCIRIIITSYGWGGPVFGIALDEQKESDKVVTIDNWKFVVESNLQDMYNKFTVDYMDNWFQKGFYVSTSFGGSSC